MAINRIGNQNVISKSSNDNDEDMKPLIREYGKEHSEIYDEVHEVLEGRISKNKSWCMIHTENYVLLMKTSASAVQELYNNILPAVNGKKAHALVVEPVKKDRYGGCLAVDDSVQRHYDFDEKELTFTLTEEAPKSKGKKQQTLTLEMFLDTTQESPTVQSATLNSETDKPSTIVGTKTRVRKSSTAAIQEDG